MAVMDASAGQQGTDDDAAVSGIVTASAAYETGIPLAGTSCVEMQLVAVPACLVALGVTFGAPVAGRR